MSDVSAKLILSKRINVNAEHAVDTILLIGELENMLLVTLSHVLQGVS